MRTFENGIKERCEHIERLSRRLSVLALSDDDEFSGVDASASYDKAERLYGLCGGYEEASGFLAMLCQVSPRLAGLLVEEEL